jgi:hypothetical protein
MRKIVTAVSAAALSLSMLATAVPALAVTGYDSAYAGESAFVNISPGQTLNFQVFFANTGTTTWSRGTGTQVDLAGCLSDKTTCNAVEAANASWNSGWLSSTRYASTVQTTTAPGALGTFSYNIAAPSNAIAGTYRFNGDLVLSSTGEKIHPEGYYQDATVGGTGTGAAITSLTPNFGTNAGGTSVVIAGSGFVCTPAFPSVSFGGTNASVTSCGATSATAVSPAHATGAVTVTLTNSGGVASNGLTYTYQDTTAPSYTAMSVASNVVTVTFSEPVCGLGATPGTDWTVNNVSGATNDPVLSSSIPACDVNPGATTGVTSANLFLTSPMPPGAFVEADLNVQGVCVNATTCNAHYRDASGNTINAPQGQTASATSAPGGAPTITSASGPVSGRLVTINFSQAVNCTAGSFADWSLNDQNSATVDPTFDAFDATNKCGTTGQTSSGTPAVYHTTSPLLAGATYTLTFNGPAGDIKNVYNVNLAAGSSVAFTTGAADFTPPTMIDARMANNLGSTDFTDIGDSFTVTFSEKMNGVQTGTISIQDQDGSTATIQCSAAGTAANNQATCSWDTAANTTVLTVSLTGVLLNSSGTTPGMQIPFNITALTGIQDVAGNPPNVLGSSDRLVDYE